MDYAIRPVTPEDTAGIVDISRQMAGSPAAAALTGMTASSSAAASGAPGRGDRRSVDLKNMPEIPVILVARMRRARASGEAKGDARQTSEQRGPDGV